MTPFMCAVEAALVAEVPFPPTSAAPALRGVAATTHHHVVARALAEQLVCEANAVLAGHGRAIELADEVGVGGLAFTLTAGARRLRIDAAGAAALGDDGLAQLVLGLVADPHPLATTNP